MQTANETDQEKSVDARQNKVSEVDPRVDDIIERYFQTLLDQTEVPEDILSKVAGNKD